MPIAHTSGGERLRGVDADGEQIGTDAGEADRYFGAGQDQRLRAAPYQLPGSRFEQGTAMIQAVLLDGIAAGGE